MKQTNRVSQIFLASCITALVLSSCGTQEKGSSSSSSSAASSSTVSSPVSSEAETTKDVGYPEELTIFAPLSEHLSKTGAKDNNACAVFPELEKITGTKVTWQHPAVGGDMATQFNLLVTSGNYPDLIQYNWPSASGGVDTYVSDGVIIRLTELIDNYMPNYARLLEERNCRKVLTYNEDDIYFISEIRKDSNMSVYMGPIMRGDWLDKLKLEAPNTLDELHTVLKAFKEGDPNGDGSEVWAMSGITFTGFFPVGSLLWPYGIHFGFYQVDGQIQYGPLQPEFADGMSYIHDLYAEGLLDPDYSIQDRNAVDGKFMNNQVGYEYGIQPSKMNNAMKDTGFRAEGIEHLRLSEDSPAYVFDTNYISYLNTGCSLAISTNCKEPEKAAHWLDYLFTDEGAMLTNYGVEGSAYTIVDGKPKFTEEFLEKQSESFATYNFGVMSTFPSLRMWETYSETLNPISAKGIETWSKSADTSRTLPTLTFTTEEQQTITDKYTDIQTYITEQYDKLVNGNTPLSDIPTIQEKIKAMGIEDVIAAYQAALDRYNS